MNLPERSGESLGESWKTGDFWSQAKRIALGLRRTDNGHTDTILTPPHLRQHLQAPGKMDFLKTS